jgi:hydrogenase nickel incorporation protein HypA/HybF
MGIALQIVDIAKSAIPRELAGTPVEAVNLRVGKLTAVVPQSLRFCFEIVSRDTPLAGAKLNIDEVPIIAKCRDCGKETTITEANFFCSHCESGKLEILSGRELTIASIEMADKE